MMSDSWACQWSANVSALKQTAKPRREKTLWFIVCEVKLVNRARCLEKHIKHQETCVVFNYDCSANYKKTNKKKQHKKMIQKQELPLLNCCSAGMKFMFQNPVTFQCDVALSIDKAIWKLQILPHNGVACLSLTFSLCDLFVAYSVSSEQHPWLKSIFSFSKLNCQFIM